MGPMSRRHPVVALVPALGLTVAACGIGGGETEVLTAPTPVPTVAGVGRLPEGVPTTAPATTTTTVVDPEVDLAAVVAEDSTGPIADRVDGNRVLVIGDSIMASTATRFGGEMCAALNPQGWSVEVDAEPGRFVEFGLRVIDRRIPDPDDDLEAFDAEGSTDSVLADDAGVDGEEGESSASDGDPDDFDVAVVHLGSNYGLDQDSYRDALTKILYQLSPRPTLLYTVTEYRPAWAEANEVIRELADLFDSVTLIDWEQVARTPGVLSSDGLHPLDAGEDVLVGLAATALGEFGPVEGECLDSPFTDDSAIGGSSGSSSTSGGTSSSSRSSSGSSSGSSSSGSSGGSSSSGSTTGGSSRGGSPTGGSTTRGPSGTGGSTSGGSGSTTGSGSGSGGSSGDGSGQGTTGSTPTGSTPAGSGDGGSDGTGGGTTTGSGDGTTAGTGGDGGSGGSSTGGDTGTTSGGTSGGSTGGSTTGGSTTGGSTTGGSATGGSTTGGSTSGGSTTGGSSTGGSTSGGSTGGSTSGGSSTGGSSSGGATSGGTTGGAVPPATTAG